MPDQIRRDGELSAFKLLLLKKIFEEVDVFSHFKVTDGGIKYFLTSFPTEGMDNNYQLEIIIN
jgi:hypothetical protein